MKNYNVLVVDFGSQYNQLIVRKVRELNVSSILVKVDKINELINNKEILNYQAVIFSGGPDVVTDKGALRVDEKIFDMNIPILGICYGMQLIGEFYGASLVESKIKEYGSQQIKVLNKENLFNGLLDVEDVWMSHGYELQNLPDKIEQLATTNDNVIGSIKVKDKNIYGMQFHPEVTDSINGVRMIDNFLTLANVTKDYTMKNYIDEKSKEIVDIVKDKNIICGLSGGVDSTVVAAMLSKILPGQVKCIFVDHGLLRKNEVELVLDSLKDLDLDIKVINAQDMFLDNLKGISNPEEKRKIIGKLFVDIFDTEAKKIKNAKFLAQGTLYTDIIESGTDTAQTIKSHHNVGGLPDDMEFDLIEPLNVLFKDEVRKLGLELGLPKKLVYRQPFPGPGLAIRIMGEITKEKIDVVKESDFIFREFLEKKGLSKDIWQSFTVLTNTKTVGVKGDERSYEYVLALRAISSIDGMTARAYPIPIDLLCEVSTKITNNIKHINRVVYDITNKPPATVEWE